MLNQKLIKALQNGEIAIDYRKKENSELLKKILREAFPNDDGNIHGSADYYYRDKNHTNLWTVSFENTLPTYTVDNFLEKEKTFPRVVLVKIAGEWVKRVAIKETKNYFVCWIDATSLEESENILLTKYWTKDVVKEIEPLSKEQEAFIDICCEIYKKLNNSNLVEYREKITQKLIEANLLINSLI